MECIWLQWQHQMHPPTNSTTFWHPKAFLGTKSGIVCLIKCHNDIPHCNRWFRNLLNSNWTHVSFTFHVVLYLPRGFTIYSYIFSAAIIIQCNNNTQIREEFWDQWASTLLKAQNEQTVQTIDHMESTHERKAETQSSILKEVRAVFDQRKLYTLFIHPSKLLSSVESQGCWSLSQRLRPKDRPPVHLSLNIQRYMNKLTHQQDSLCSWTPSPPLRRYNVFWITRLNTAHFQIRGSRYVELKKSPEQSCVVLRN